MWLPDGTGKSDSISFPCLCCVIQIRFREVLPFPSRICGGGGGGVGGDGCIGALRCVLCHTFEKEGVPLERTAAASASAWLGAMEFPILNIQDSWIVSENSDVLELDAEQMLVESCLTSKERREREHYLVTDTTDLRPVLLVLNQNIMVFGQGLKAL